MVKPGYKETEIGVIPEEWKLIDFKTCFTVVHNNTYSRAEMCKNGTIMNIHYGDILIRYGSILDCSRENIPYLTNSCLKVDNSSYLLDGDIVLADTAEDETVGKSIEIYNSQDKKIVSGLHTIPCRPNFIFAPCWLGYYINSSLFHNQLLPFITGTKVSAIAKNAISNIKIVYPSFNEQQKIAEALSDMDELINSLEKLIAKKKVIKQGAMQELLTGKKRLPGFSGKWGKIKIGDGGFLTKSSINPQYYPNEIFVEYSMPAFDNGRVPFIKKGHAMHSNRIIIDGEILLFNKLNVRQRRIWLISNCESKAVCSSEFLAYKSIKIDLPLLSQILNTDKVTDDFINMSTGTSNSQRRITPTNFLEYVINLPAERKEQQAIASILSDMDAEIEALEQKLQKCRNTKQGMMQQLLTGKIRLV